MAEKKNGVRRTPMIIQMEALECGAACLTMILAYYGKWIPLEQVREDCGVSRDGSRASNLLKAARSYGMKTKAYRMEPEQIRSNDVFPCIIHWNFNHYVVLKGFRGNYAYLNDPARGEVRVTAAEFDDAFTGVCMFFEPGENFTPGGKKKGIITYLKKRGQGIKWIVAFVILATLTEKLISVIEPGFTRIFYDYLLTGKNPEWLTPFTAALGLLTLLRLVAQWILTDGNRRASAKLNAVGSTSFMWKVLRLPMSFFSQRMSGDILERENSSGSISETLVNTFAPAVFDLIMMVVWFVAMIRYNVLLTAIGLFGVLANAGISTIITRRQVNVLRASMKDRGMLSTYTVNGISMIETIKASGSEDGYFEKWSGYQAGVNNADIEYARFNQRAGILSNIASTVSDTVILFISVWLTVQGRYSLGMLTAFQAYLNNFTSPVSNLVSAFKSIHEMRTEMDRVEDVMEYPDDPVFNAKSEDGTALHKLSGDIELKNIVFGYSKLEEPLIRDFSLHIPAGSSVALVGGSGSGKSTMSKLISGLYQPWSGEILFDGKTMTGIDRSVFNGSLSVVDQDITLFHDSIRDNIRMWDEAIEDFEVILAARDAQIHQDIMQREGGYDYILAENGMDFSGGQRQRLEIARVLAQDPTICILDEATSALDAETEQKVIRAIRNRGITCIVIAHRLSTIRDCDQILVLDQGEVVQQGTHDQLIREEGLYATLVTSD